MTKNDGYEVGTIQVGVAYGTNVKEVRELLIDAIAKLGITNEKKDIIVRLQSFDDSCITLKILVWLNVLTQGNDISVVMECIYDTLNITALKSHSHSVRLQLSINKKANILAYLLRYKDYR